MKHKKHKICPICGTIVSQTRVCPGCGKLFECDIDAHPGRMCEKCCKKFIKEK